SGENAASATIPACPLISRSTSPRRASMISTRCAEHTASRAPSGEYLIRWFGPKLIRTMASARSASVMPDIMDHVTTPDTAGLRLADGLGGRRPQPGPQVSGFGPVRPRLDDTKTRALQRLGQVSGMLEPLVGQAERGGQVVDAGAMRGAEEPLE